MIGLSDTQLEIILSTAEPLSEEKCQEFLERVAAVLRGRGQINDDDVSVAVQLALRDLIENSEVWKEWKRNSPPKRKMGWRDKFLNFFASGFRRVRSVVNRPTGRRTHLQMRQLFLDQLSTANVEGAPHKFLRNQRP
jgi:hypothetical protein